MLDLQWSYKRYAEVFAGVQRYAGEQGWVSIIDEFADDTLRRVAGGAGRGGTTGSSPGVRLGWACRW